jgi:hypothetical protein
MPRPIRNYKALDQMADQYRELRRTVDAVVETSKGPVPSITHGYDYAHPSGQGFSMLSGLITTG